MAVVHRALFTWFILLIFLILLDLRLDQRIQWNWFIVFIPMWLYDHILLIYRVFNMISHCKNERVINLRREFLFRYGT
ncbi:transmembrane protein 60 [Ptiloglossa arizonensis]|uniref:transmembrane protein 60 n=1 Tax=Ptiloglossa arizonensis TaxID=3350558 RepID=UPI003F9F3140